MAIVRYRLDPSNPPTLSPETRARLDAMTDEEITRAAQSDPDNPPLTEEELEQMRAVLLVRTVLAKLKLSEGEFADTYGLDPARLRALAEGRVAPDPVLISYLALIEDDPERALLVLRRLERSA